MSRSRTSLLWLIFAIVLTVYVKGRVATSFDSGYAIHMAVSLLEEGNLDLEEYRDVIPASDYRVMEIDGVLQSRYPVGPSVVAVPVVLILATVGKYVFYIWDLDVFLRSNQPSGIERFIGSFMTALTAVVMFYIARLRLSYGWSMLVLLLFAFGTSAWSVTSRALWQHAPSMLFLSVALYGLIRARDEPRLSQYAGLFLALAYAMRPTNALVVVSVTLYVLAVHRVWFWRYIGWASLVAVPFVSYNLAIFGSPLPWYYRQASGSFNLFDPSFLEAAAGNLVSPARGLFVYSPVFLFSLLGVALLLRQKRWNSLDTCLAVTLVLHWLIISSWKVWWGGTVFGPRLFADMLPFLTYFLIPVIEQLERPRLQGRVLAAALAIAIAASCFMHRSGALYWATWDWNVEPENIGSDPSRLWDWSDPPFLRRTSEIHPDG